MHIAPDLLARLDAAAKVMAITSREMRDTLRAVPREGLPPEIAALVANLETLQSPMAETADVLRELVAAFLPPLPPL